VKAGLVNRPLDYSWSSLGSYLLERKKLKWLDTKEVLGYFGGRRKALLEFMHGKVEREIVRFKGAAWSYGSEGFIQRIGALQGNKGLNWAKELQQEPAVLSRVLGKLAEELASNPELRGVVETLCDNLRKGRRLKRSIRFR